MKFHLAILIGALGMVLAAGCKEQSVGLGPDLNSSRANVTSGVAGIVRRGPIAPVEREGVDNTAPMADATIVIDRAEGGRVGHVVSDQDGLFFVSLAPGVYVFTPQHAAGGIGSGAPAPERVTVSAGGVSEVRFEYDTGIR